MKRSRLKRTRKTSNARYPELLAAVYRRDGTCRLAEWLERDGGVGECDGPLDAAHILPKNRIRRHLGRDSEVVWDERLSVLACRRHHNMLDDRRARLPRWRIPAFTEVAAAMHGLDRWLDRDYGPRKASVR